MLDPEQSLLLKLDFTAATLSIDGPPSDFVD